MSEVISLFRRCPVFLFLFLTGYASGVYGSDSAIVKIQKAYENIKEIKGSFVQKSTIKDLKRTDTFKGTFVIKVPSKMRWRYSDSRQSTEVIINNDQLLIYQMDKKQVIKGRFDRQSYGQTPIALLGGFGNVSEEFEVSEKGGRLLLKPRKLMGSVVSIELVPSDGEFPIASLSIIDKRSNTIDIALKEITVNPGIKDSAFDFSVPQGVSVFEYK
ncbi:MAG TPA: outer-membrane lipoprotein carrier protein LolA [Thermodesulfovibrionales bacterium]|nr:outer-membrane lipoprotein carrier protein LolA [Thermodesulfovibrionales bacterium]